MSDQTLRSAVIKLAHANPELRPSLLPLLADVDKVAAAKPPGSGWQKTPGGHGGGMRREKKDGHGWDYWFPSAEHAAKAAEAHKKDSEENRGEEEKHNSAAYKHHTSAQDAKADAKHHDKQADYHSSQGRVSNAAEHASAQQHHEGESESRKSDAKKHEAKSNEHREKSRDHKYQADAHHDAAQGAAAFAAQKKPSLWEKTKALFSGKK